MLHRLLNRLLAPFGLVLVSKDVFEGLVEIAFPPVTLGELMAHYAEQPHMPMRLH